MSSSDIANTVIIIVIFAIINLIAILSIGISHIENNWNQYKCKPIIIPFASIFGHNTSTNFQECVQDIEQSFMSDLLTPVYNVFDELSSVGSEIGSFINIVNSLGGQFQMGFLGSISKLYTKIQNIVLGTSNIGIKFTDLIGKVTAVMFTIISLLEGINVLGLSIACGLPGSVVKGVTGESPCPTRFSNGEFNCFSVTDEASCNNIPAAGNACKNTTDGPLSTDCGNFCWYDPNAKPRTPKCQFIDTSCSYLNNWDPDNTNNSNTIIYSQLHSWQDVENKCNSMANCTFYPASSENGDVSMCKPNNSTN